MKHPIQTAKKLQKTPGDALSGVVLEPALESKLRDVAIATNPFELFLDYGVQIEARSPAVQTFLIQLATNARHHGYHCRCTSNDGGNLCEKKGQKVSPAGTSQGVLEHWGL